MSDQLTDKQKEELVEAIKGPHYYRIVLNGYGAETSYMRISEEAYNFWEPLREEHGDSDVIHYCIHAEDYKPSEVNEDGDYEEISGADIPRAAMFLHEEDDMQGRPWYEPPDEIDHVWGVSADGAYVTIDKVDGDDYNSKHLEDIIDHEDLNDLAQRIGDETDWEVELTGADHDYGNKWADKGDYICQFQSAEKGTFFEAILQTDTLFDIKKLRVLVAEAPSGEDTVYGVTYDGEELDNVGGDTNGKGYYVYFWKQEY